MLREADEYRWHDLRKDPEDLPKEDEKLYLVRTKNSVEIMLGEFIRLHLSNIVFASNEVYDTILGWKEIEPFKEVQDEI